MRSFSSWERSRVEFLAISLQRLFRGCYARSIVWKKRYIRLNEAVKRIQRCYRKFKMFQFARMRRPHGLKDDFHTGNWPEVVMGHGTFEERMVVWRSVIELRRSHPSFNTELCLRALTLAEGDIARAQIIIGYPEFYMRFQAAPEIARFQRECFLPSMRSDKMYLAPPSTLDSKENEAGNIGGMPTLSITPKVGHVKAQQLNPSIAPGGVDFSDVIETAYFSTKFFGNTQTSTQQKIKAKATKRPASATRKKNPLKKTLSNMGMT